jgi:hypothetical protein
MLQAEMACCLFLLFICFAYSPILKISRICCSEMSDYLRTTQHHISKRQSVLFRVTAMGTPNPTNFVQLWCRHLHWTSSSEENVGLIGPPTSEINPLMTDWLVHCCWPSRAQWFLVPSRVGLMIIFYSLTALSVFFSIYIRIQPVPHRKHITSPLQDQSVNAV